MISVALCTYNGERYIRQQLDSILSQSLPVDEIVIFDDKSDDETFCVLKQYGLKNSQIRLFQNEENIGYKKNFERALLACQGDYIFFSDQDDIWDLYKVEKAVDYLKRTKMMGAFTNALLIDGQNNRIGHSLFSIKKLNLYIDNGVLPESLFPLLCLKGNFVTGATLVITKEAKELVLPFKISKFLVHDQWIALKLASISKLGYLNETLISYRIHDGQQIGVSLSNVNQRENLLDCFMAKGNCRDLLHMRKLTAYILFLCNFSDESKKILFRTYKMLYFNNMKGNFLERSADFLIFLFMESFVFLQSKIGYGLRK